MSSGMMRSSPSSSRRWSRAASSSPGRLTDSQDGDHNDITTGLITHCQDGDHNDITTGLMIMT